MKKLKKSEGTNSSAIDLQSRLVNIEDGVPVA